MTQWVYTFGDGKAEGQAGMKNLLGGKGANLAEMSNLGLPVPPGFTITTEVCTYYYDHGRAYPQELKGQVEQALAYVGKLTGRTFGDAANPLLVSVRSGARASMPGMMDTVLNLGLNDVTVEALAKGAGDERFAYDSYRRFITMYSNVVLDIEHHHFEEILDEYKDRKGYTLDTDMTAADWKAILPRYKALVEKELGKPFPQEPQEQLWGAIGAVFGSWMNNRAIKYRELHAIPGELGHGGERAGHGVRQYGRDLRHRRGVHPQSLHRRERALRRVPHQRAGRGCGGGHPHPAGHHGSRAHRVGLRQALDGRRHARGLWRARAHLRHSREALP